MAPGDRRGGRRRHVAGLSKQLAYASQIQARIRAIEAELVLLAAIYVLRPGLLM